MTRRKAEDKAVPPEPEDGAIPGQVFAPCQPGRGRTFGIPAEDNSTQSEQPEGAPDAEPAGEDGGND